MDTLLEGGRSSIGSRPAAAEEERDVENRGDVVLAAEERR
jgi:hypothetical protein